MTFFGDLTMWSTWRIKAYRPPRCPYANHIKTDRCDVIDKINLTRTHKWTPPRKGAEGPAAYGLTHPFCTDCSGCQSEIFSGNRAKLVSAGDCMVQNYVAMEFARDVEMQSKQGLTTQESYTYVLAQSLPSDVCVVSAGFHDMAIPEITDKTFVSNTKWYLGLLQQVCKHIIWIESSATVDNTKYAQRTDRLSRWNDMVVALLERESQVNPVFSVVRLLGASRQVKHLDNIHMDKSWYRALNYLISATLKDLPMKIVEDATGITV
jgi:hypothetical protein